MPPLRRPLLLASALVAACAPAPSMDAADRRAYRAALTDPDAARAVTTCAAIAAPLLRGDCVVGVMQLTGERDPAFCAVVPEGTPFHPECWFTAADDPDLPLDERWARCAPAGAYAPECRQHQRGREAAAVGASERAVSEKVALVADLIARDAHPTDGPAGFPERTWYALWLGHHQASGRVDVGVCAGLDAAAAACVGATDRLVEHTVRQALQVDRSRCAAPAASLATARIGAGPPLGDAPSTVARIATWQQAICGGAAPSPGPGPPG